MRLLKRRSPAQGRHLPALDGLRGLAVLLVVVFHIYQVEPSPAQPISRLLYGATRLGQTGVDLFFVLSGFLITGILYDTKRSSRFFLNFYGRRTLRIFPLYYGVLVVAFILLPFLFHYRGAGSGTVWLWTYTTNLPVSFGREWGPFGHFWSLAIEEQFYLVWPLVVYAFRRETLLRICVGCVAGAVVSRLVVESLGFSSFTFTLCRMDSLTLGAFLALAGARTTRYNGLVEEGSLVRGGDARSVSAALLGADRGRHFVGTGREVHDRRDPLWSCPGDRAHRSGIDRRRAVFQPSYAPPARKVQLRTLRLSSPDHSRHRSPIPARTALTRDDGTQGMPDFTHVGGCGVAELAPLRETFPYSEEVLRVSGRERGITDPLPGRCADSLTGR